MTFVIWLIQEPSDQGWHCLSLPIMYNVYNRCLKVYSIAVNVVNLISLTVYEPNEKHIRSAQIILAHWCIWQLWACISSEERKYYDLKEPYLFIVQSQKITKEDDCLLLQDNFKNSSSNIHVCIIYVICFSMFQNFYVYISCCWYIL